MNKKKKTIYKLLFPVISNVDDKPLQFYSPSPPEMSLPFELPPPASTSVDLDRVADVIARAFDPLPVSQYIHLSLSTGATQDEINRYYRKAIDKYLQQGAIIIQAHDHAAVAIWFPPVCKKEVTDSEPKEVASESEKDLSPNLARVIKAFDEAIDRHDYYKADHWHLKYLARDASREYVPGAISSLVRPFLSHSQESGVPCVLEAAMDQQAAKVYKHWGFRSTDMVTVDGIDMLELMVYNN